MSISDSLKTRLTKDRPMTSITLRIPVDVVDSLKAIAPQRGMAGYQSLLKLYLSEGLRRDEALYANTERARLLEALRRHGVPQSVLDEAAQEIATAWQVEFRRDGGRFDQNGDDHVCAGSA